MDNQTQPPATAGYPPAPPQSVHDLVVQYAQLGLLVLGALGVWRGGVPSPAQTQAAPISKPADAKPAEPIKGPVIQQLQAPAPASLDELVRVQLQNIRAKRDQDDLAAAQVAVLKSLQQQQAPPASTSLPVYYTVESVPVDACTTGACGSARGGFFRRRG